MVHPELAVRELTVADIPLIIAYWLESDPDFMKAMGVDLAKLPAKGQWQEMLEQQIRAPYDQKQSYCLVWLIDGQPAGHSNVNKIIFGEEAYMHLHLWHSGTRKQGAGTKLVRLSLPYFFRQLQLKKIYCEPYALNPAPNKTLPRLGFELVREYTTTPGFICFEQPVRLWKLTKERFRELSKI